MDSLAILERGYLYPTPASAIGVKSDCPFCIARHIINYRLGDEAVMLQMRDAGRLLIYTESRSGDGVDGFEWLDEPGSRISLLRDHWLTLPVEALTVPFWLPPLSLRHCFVCDELAVWFCTESICGTGFHWDCNRVIELARTTWERRLPISGTSFSKVLLAHGLPAIYQQEFEKLFDFSVATLVSAKGRPALKKFVREKRADQTLFEIWSRK